MYENRRKLRVIAGRFGAGKPAEFEVVEEREPTTNYPKAGESVQPHILQLRGPAYDIIDKSFDAGVEYGIEAGLMKVFLTRPITADDFVAALLGAYRLVGMSEKEARRHIKTKPGKHVKIGTFGVLTETGKMGCYSFNLPPGPMFQGGACPASELGFMMQTASELKQQQSRVAFGLRVLPPDFICNGCYALKGSYGNPSMVFMMGMRKKLVDRWLSDGDFVDKMTQAIAAGQEKSIARREKTARSNWWKIPHPDFFRIHDAGDMFSPKYAEAWFEVCRRLPRINFWAPTRMWLMKSGANKAFAKGVPDNLALRPSAVHFGESAPEVSDPATADASLLGVSMPGLSSGSGSGSEVPDGAWPCPAYDHVTKGGGAKYARVKGSRRLAGGTCSRAQGPESPFHGGTDSAQEAEPRGHGCRACWLERETQIFYHEH